MKKILSLILATAFAVSAVACSNISQETTTEEAKTVTVSSLNGNKEKIEVEVPFDPQRVAVLDMPSLDIIDSLGVGDRVVGSADTTIEYLQEYMNTDKVANIGTIKEPDMEAVMSVEPDIIFIGGRLAGVYDELGEIAPVVYLSIDKELGLYESTKNNVETVATIFGKEDEVEEKFSNFDERISALQSFAEGKNAVVGIVTSGSYNLLGNDGKCSIIGNDIGFENIGVKDDGTGTSTHGNETSFELIKQLNPDYMFVLDKDAAIAIEGAKLAQEIVENELVKSTDTYKNGNIVYLEHSSVWYTAEGGITALDYMLGDLETALLK